MRAVLDASAFVDDGLGLVELDVLHADAPAHIDLEVVSAIRGMRLRGRVDDTGAADLLDLWRRAVVRRHPLRRLTPRVWDLRHAIATPDAYYVALAEALDVPLITRDRRLARVAERYCEVLAP